MAPAFCLSEALKPLEAIDRRVAGQLRQETDDSYSDGADPINVAIQAPMNAWPAAFALARLFSNQRQASRPPLGTVEIKAFSRKLNTMGSLRAIRTILPGGQAQFQVLETAGDAVVNEQVLEPYLCYEERASQLPPSSTAFTAANYRFRFARAVRQGQNLAYEFRVVPRERRKGLINGVLWIDANTGIPVHASGYLVENLPMSMKRVHITRDVYNEDGVESCVRHFFIDMRAVGRVELVVLDRSASYHVGYQETH